MNESDFWKQIIAIVFWQKDLNSNWKNFWKLKFFEFEKLLRWRNLFQKYVTLTTPWFLHRAHFGVLWYLSDAALRKNAGGIPSSAFGCWDIKFDMSTLFGKLIFFSFICSQTFQFKNPSFFFVFWIWSKNYLILFKNNLVLFKNLFFLTWTLLDFKKKPSKTVSIWTCWNESSFELQKTIKNRKRVS